MSDKLTNPIFLGSQRLGLILLLLFVPLNLAQAQDFAKVETKLKKSVAKGHLTEQQAKAMMETLRRIMDRDANANPHAENSKNREAKLADAGARTRRVVATGEITEEDGRARMDSAREILAGEKPLSGDATLEEFALKIRQAVRNGRISAEDGRARMEAFKKQLAMTISDGQVDETQLQRVAKRLRLAVQNGDLTDEEARGKFRAIKEQLGQRDDHGGDHDVDGSQQRQDDADQGR